MINTYNESHLHKTLKTYYAQIYDGKTEQKFDKFIFDIFSSSKGIFEIQTGSFNALKQKCSFAIKNKINFTIIHPIIVQKKIETFSEDGIFISSRLSPKKENIYSKLRAMTGLAELLPNKYVKIIFINVAITEKKVLTKEKVQLKNKSRRFLKEWYKDGQTLTEIFDEQVLKTKSDFLKLLPPLKKDIKEFSSKEIKEVFLDFADKKIAKIAIKNTNLLLWILHKMNLIEKTQIRSRLIYYKLKNKRTSNCF